MTWNHCWAWAEIERKDRDDVSSTLVHDLIEVRTGLVDGVYGRFVTFAPRGAPLGGARQRKVPLASDVPLRTALPNGLAAVSAVRIWSTLDDAVTPGNVVWLKA